MKKRNAREAESTYRGTDASPTMRIFLSAGEPSGDLHAANLIQALRERLPDAEFVGFGGPADGRGRRRRVLYPLVDLAVMWFGRVLLNLHKFLGAGRRRPTATSATSGPTRSS